MITFLALAHMLDAAQLVRGGWGGGMITFLALAHMLDAAQLVRGGWGDDHIPCACTHVGCCATGQGWGGCFSFGVQTSGEYISTMFGCI